MNITLQAGGRSTDAKRRAEAVVQPLGAAPMRITFSSSRVPTTLAALRSMFATCGPRFAQGEWRPLCWAGSTESLEISCATAKCRSTLCAICTGSCVPREALKAVLEMRRLLREIRPDIVSTHSTTAGIFGHIAARSLGSPSCSRRTAGASPTVVRWSSGSSSGSPNGRRRRSRRKSSPCCRSGPPGRDPKPLDAQSAARGDPERNAGSLGDSLRARPESDPPKIVMVARLSSWKDQPTLLRALAQLRHLDWELELVGDGPRRQELETLANSLGIASRVRFAGYCADVPARLAEAQLFVLATKWEGFPRSILEALRAACP